MYCLTRSIFITFSSHGFRWNYFLWHIQMNAREERIYLKLGGEYREFGRNGRERTYIFRNMSRLEGYVLRDAEVMMMDADGLPIIPVRTYMYVRRTFFDNTILAHQPPGVFPDIEGRGNIRARIELNIHEFQNNQQTRNDWLIMPFHFFYRDFIEGRNLFPYEAEFQNHPAPVFGTDHARMMKVEKFITITGQPTRVPEGECTICQTEFVQGGNAWRKLSCGHFFHTACIQSYWTTLEGRKICPICRKNVQQRSRKSKSKKKNASKKRSKRGSRLR